MLACEYVLVIVSPASLTDPRVVRAVEVALARGFDHGRLVAIPTPGAPRAERWPGRFAALARLAMPPIRDDGEVDRAAASLVARIGAPLAEAEHHLPVLERTLRELEGHGVPPTTLDDLVDILGDCAERYRARDYRGAASHLDEAMTVIEAYVPGFRPYFVRIARGVCDLHQGFDPTTRLRELEDHPLRDEAWYAALGVAALRAGRRDEARLRFRTALAERGARGVSGFDVLAQLYRLDADDEPLPPPVATEDAMTVRCVRAARELARGLPEIAASELQGVPIGCHGDVSIQLLAHALIELEAWSAAIAHLELYIANRAPDEPSLSVSRTLARCYTAIGALDRAVEVYGRALRDADGHEGTWIDYARVLRMRGDEATARAICRRVIETTPRDPESFYCVGFAYYLLGDRRAADAMYRAAREYRGRPYDDVLHQDGV